uniref:CULT domain-containing protein n=2 Tax=Plectus sambesii TaxID=2011161 RepID=A0A914V4V1_9BILA
MPFRIWILLLLTHQLVSTVYSATQCQSHKHEPHLLCRMCGHEIAKGSSIIRKKSSMALSSFNLTVMNNDCLVQLFENGVPEQFDVFTVTQADLALSGKPTTALSWFPGYAWTAALCPKCGVHLGWRFEANVIDSRSGRVVKDSFDGLVLDFLLSEEYSNSLTKVPKLSW